MIKLFKANSEMCLILLLILGLLVMSIFCSWYSEKEVKKALLQEKYTQIVNFVDMLAISANEDNEETIIKDTEFIDELNQIYAALYKIQNGEFIILSERNFETSIFEPLDYEEFANAVSSQDSGDVIIGYTPENQSHRDMYIYFKRITADENYLVVAGVSEHSITVSINGWILSGKLTSAFIIFIFFAVIVFLFPHYKKKTEG